MPTPASPAEVQAFIERWDKVTVNEIAASQTHFNELCRLLGVTPPLEADPSGDFFRFEKPLTKAGGAAGRADVWYKHRFAWEYKTKGKYATLRDAYLQLLLYKDDLDNPPILVACDIATYEVHVAFTGYPSRVHKFTNASLENASTRDLLRAVLTNPELLRPVERAETITEKAAARLAKVAQLLEGRKFAPTQIAPFFMQVLFALFAEDVQLLPAELMSRSIKKAVFNTEEFPERAKGLFRAMREGGYFGEDRVPRFNGWLYNEANVLPLNADELQFLGEAAKLDWSAVEPAIFGTLFERSLDPKKRAQLGAHYTSKEDILLIVEPVLMQPLRKEWEAVKEGIEALRVQWEQTAGNAQRKLQSVAEGMVLDFMERIAKVRVLDPACGSGNFLYVALLQLKDFEKEVWTYAGGVGLPQPELAVSPAQLFGIEKNAFAAELAQVVVWIGYLQWMKNNGFLEGSPKEPILQTLHTIENRDAILTVDLNGQPAEPEWPEADVIVGNPPFLGAKNMRGELGDEYTTALRRLYIGRVPGSADLVTFWFERARAQIEKKKTSRAGLLATKVIRQKNNLPVMDKIKSSGDIFFAWSDRDWILDGASLRIVMVGFDDGNEKTRLLDGVQVTNINADLSATQNLVRAGRLMENRSIAFMGITKAGASDISHTEAEKLLREVNKSGYLNKDVVRPWLIGDDVTDRPRHRWIIDFGTDATEEEAAQYEAPFAYLQQNVMPARVQNLRASHPSKWWIHERPRPAMRSAIASLPRYAATVLVAKHRFFVWVPADVLPAARLIVFARCDDYFLGVLQSKPHELWSLRMAGSHGGERPTYNATTCFETFPFPWAPGTEPSEEADERVKAIAETARELVKLRDNWLNPPAEALAGVKLKERTLTNLYNKRPDWLSEAHRKLDEAVFTAYGWESDLSDDQILERLLALNLERAAKQGNAPAAVVEEESE